VTIAEGAPLHAAGGPPPTAGSVSGLAERATSIKFSADVSDGGARRTGGGASSRGGGGGAPNILRVDQPPRAPRRYKLAVPRGAFLAQNSVGYAWDAPRAVPLTCHAARALHLLMREPAACGAASDRCAAARLVTALQHAIADAATAGGKGKAKKGKGMKLPPEHEDACVHVTACLKCLTAHSPANAYRVARMGALPLLVQMAEAPRLMLRRNAQAVFSMLSLCAEAAPLLAPVASAALPDVKTIRAPLRLHAAELNELRIEFAGDGLLKAAAPAGAAPPPAPGEAQRV
jgi:hypothetical protein